jgi:hypothetical protein
MLDLWGNVGFLVLTFGSLLFTVSFLLGSKFYKTFMGWVIAVFVTALTVLCLYFSLRVWEIAIPGVEWVRLIIFWVLGLSLVSGAIGFLEIQFGKRGEALRARLAAKQKLFDDLQDKKPNTKEG